MKCLKVLMLTFLITLSGCSATKTMNGIMSSWVGSDINEAVTQWGYPHEQREFQGRKLYVWNRNVTMTTPQTTTTTANVYSNSVHARSTTTGGNTIYGNCQRILEVNDDSRIVSWEWSGNNCPLLEVMEYSDWRRNTDSK